MKIFKKKKETPSLEKIHLQSALLDAKNALDTAHSNFNNATDPVLIDCFIYQVQSEELRYKFLLTRAKELNL